MGRCSFRVPPANLLGAALGAVCLLGATPAGAIFVTTLPGAAAVWVDGTYVGRSPAVVDALNPGSHHLTVSLSGWRPRDLDVSVEASQTAVASVVLQRESRTDPAAGTIRVHLPGGSRIVALDGAPARPSAEGELSASAGTHELVVMLPAGKATRTVTVYPQTRTDVVLQQEANDQRSPVIAPVDDYIPESAVRIAGTHVEIRYRGHVVNGTIGERAFRIDGKAVAYDASPVWIGSRLFLPIDLVTMLREK